MKCVVLGSAGFIGSRICHQLLIEGKHRVIGIDAHVGGLYPSATKVARTRKLLELGNASFSFIEANLANFELRPILEGVDVVINEAAMPGLALSWKDFEAYNTSNLKVVSNVLEALRYSSNAHLVHASTSSVYGKHAAGPENSPLDPISPYGVTKLAAEKLISSYQSELGISATILRYFSVFGPGQRPDMAYAKFIRALMKGATIEVFGDGKQVRSNTYIDDVVSASILACSSDFRGQIFNISGTQDIELLDAIGVLADELQIDPNLVFREEVPGDQRITRGDSRKARQILGWKPKFDVVQGLRLQARAALKESR